MNPAHLYPVCQTMVLVIAVGLVMSIIFALRFLLLKLRVDKKRRRYYLLYISLGFLCWMSFLALLALSGFFKEWNILPPRILVAVLPPLVLTLILVSSKRFGRLLKFIPPAWLVYIQSFRIVMEVFLWMGYKAGFVPFQMTFEGLNFDILAGLTALLAAPVFFGNGRFRSFEAIIWNISGITLLINIVIISALSTPSPFRVFMNEPANTMIADFPFIFILGIIVPFALAMHFFSIKQLIAAEQTKVRFNPFKRR